MSDATDVRAASDPRRSMRRRRTRVLAGVAAVALVGTGAVAWHWWTHPTAFTSLGDSYRSHPLPLADAALSTTVIFPKVSGDDEEITIEGLDATFSDNSAEADATFWLCHMSPGEDPIGAVHDPGSVCGDIEAFRPPMRFAQGIAPDSDYLFVTITPTRQGVAHLETVDVDYRRSRDHFHQHGTQTIRVDRIVTAR